MAVIIRKIMFLKETEICLMVWLIMICKNAEFVNRSMEYQLQCHKDVNMHLMEMACRQWQN